MTVHRDVDVDKLLETSDVPVGPALKSFLGLAERDVGHLQSLTNSLPVVEEDGSSECPFAEKLFAEKEEAERKVAGHVQKLNRCLVELGRELDRCRGNLQRIEVDQQSLRLTKPINEYSRAALAQRDQCYHAQNDQEAVTIVLSRAEAVLEAARNHKFPGREPRNRSSSAPPLPTPDRVGNARGNTSLGGEVKNLISLGPIQTGGGPHAG